MDRKVLDVRLRRVGSAQEPGRASMFHAVYTSTATRLMSSSELTDILTVSRRNNAERDITGMVLDKTGMFMQVLKGERDAVLERLAAIEADGRHHGISRMIEAEGQRQFPDWSMGFRDLDSPGVRALEDYSEFMNTPLNAPAFSTGSNRAQRLLFTVPRDECSQRPPDSVSSAVG
jgi:hypothetical protein